MFLIIGLAFPVLLLVLIAIDAAGQARPLAAGLPDVWRLPVRHAARSPRPRPSLSRA